MASILTWDAVYISVQDAKDSLDSLSVLTDDEVQSLIYQAQVAIDSYIKKSRSCSCECDQEFIFPITKTDCDWNDTCFIPKDIQMATLYIADYINNSWIDTVSIRDITMEKTWPHQVSFWTTDKDVDWLPIPKFVLKLLRKWKNRFYSQEI